MKKTAARFLVTAAAASMAFAPIAAQANTRAGDNAPVYTSNTAAQPGLGREAEGEDVRGATGIILLIFAAAAAIGGIIVIADNNDNGQSPGT